MVHFLFALEREQRYDPPESERAGQFVFVLAGLLDGRRGRMALVVADNQMRDLQTFNRIVRSIRFR